MTCVSKEYEVKTKMVHEQWLQLKMLFLLGYNLKMLLADRGGDWENPGGGFEGIEFPSLLKKEHAEILRVNSKKSGISSSDHEKTIWNFHRSWYFALEFPTCATQLCGISKGEAWFSLEFPRVKRQMGYSRKKTKQEGLRKWKFQGYQRNSMWNIQRLIKNVVEFPGFHV